MASIGQNLDRKLYPLCCNPRNLWVHIFTVSNSVAPKDKPCERTSDCLVRIKFLKIFASRFTQRNLDSSCDKRSVPLQMRRKRPPGLHLHLPCALKLYSNTESKRIQNHDMKFPPLMGLLLSKMMLQVKSVLWKSVSLYLLPVSRLVLPSLLPPFEHCSWEKSGKCTHPKVSIWFEVVIFTRTLGFSISQTATTITRNPS